MLSLDLSSVTNKDLQAIASSLEEKVSEYGAELDKVNDELDTRSQAHYSAEPVSDFAVLEVKDRDGAVHRVLGIRKSGNWGWTSHLANGSWGNSVASARSNGLRIVQMDELWPKAGEQQ